jgi:hypothetical protein
VVSDRVKEGVAMLRCQRSGSVEHNSKLFVVQCDNRHGDLPVSVAACGVVLRLLLRLVLGSDRVRGALQVEEGGTLRVRCQARKIGADQAHGQSGVTCCAALELMARYNLMEPQENNISSSAKPLGSRARATETGAGAF